MMNVQLQIIDYLVTEILLASKCLCSMTAEEEELHAHRRYCVHCSVDGGRQQMEEATMNLQCSLGRKATNKHRNHNHASTSYYIPWKLCKSCNVNDFHTSTFKSAIELNNGSGNSYFCKEIQHKQQIDWLIERL